MRGTSAKGKVKPAKAIKEWRKTNEFARKVKRARAELTVNSARCEGQEADDGERAKSQSKGEGSEEQLFTDKRADTWLSLQGVGRMPREDRLVTRWCCVSRPEQGSQDTRRRNASDHLRGLYLLSRHQKCSDDCTFHPCTCCLTSVRLVSITRTTIPQHLRLYTHTIRIKQIRNYFSEM